jgi:RimJ/RimL family protein N-acetyltransferase
MGGAIFLRHLNPIEESMITGHKVRLREKKLADARYDYIWRTDPELAALDAAPLLSATFQEYLSDYTMILRYPTRSRYQFAIETLDGKHIGNCSYYDIDETSSETELGIMIGDRDYWEKGYGTDAVATLVDHIFSQTKLKRIHLKTLRMNKRAQRCFQKCGFKPYSRLVMDGYYFMLMEIDYKLWQKQQGGEPNKKPGNRVVG